MARRVSILNWWTKSNGEVYTYDELYGNKVGYISAEAEKELRDFLIEKAEARQRQKKFMRIQFLKDKKAKEAIAA